MRLKMNSPAIFIEKDFPPESVRETLSYPLEEIGGQRDAANQGI